MGKLLFLKNTCCFCRCLQSSVGEATQYS